MRSYFGLFIAVAMVATIPVKFCLAHGSGGGGGDTPGMVSNNGGARTPEEMAKAAFTAGVRMIKKAQDYDADAAKAATPEKSAKAHDKAQKAYQESLAKFIDAVAAQPSMYQAWNYLGFAQRHLGHYDDSLSAYAKALALNPTYPDAIEYRGEAYLGLNMIQEAKDAYMSLFRDSRPLADELMTAMHQWADARRKDAQGVSPTEVEAFATWMDERSGIAAQTASLAIGTVPVWR